VFKEILKESALGVVIELEKDKKYEVSIKTNPFVHNWIPESYVVDVNRANEIFLCNCKGFEFEGFLCQHGIKVLHHVGLEHLPKRYILHRWCKEANSNVKRSVVERSMEHG
jgi:SWIM zinc finger